MLSVVIPLFNKEKTISATLQSVLNQSFQDFEIIVVNDGSTDNSISIVEVIKDERIRIINQENQGVSSARNKGIKEAKYKWITFLDADDLWMENHLEALRKMIIDYPNEQVFCTSFIRSTQQLKAKSSNAIQIINNYFERSLNEFIAWTSVMCIKKEVFERVGYFNIKLSRGEDLDMWARLAKFYPIVKSSEITAIYNIDIEGSLSAQKSVLHKSILSTINLKGLEGFERKYFKKMLLRRIKSSIKDLSLKEVFILLKKHNVELLK